MTRKKLLRNRQWSQAAKATAVLIALALEAQVGMAQGTIRVVPLGGGATATKAAADCDTVKVQGRGVGLNKIAALKDAYRDAIERAVGLYVDAEQVAQNDELVKDQVLTQSNAYITDCRELGEEKIDGGLVQVRILATVKKTALTTKLSGVMPAQTVALNTGLQNVHAQLATKEKRAEDAAALLKNALDGINPMTSLMVAGIRPETQKILTDKSSSGSVKIRYLFEIKLDRAKYFTEFVPHLKKTLEQISLSPPKEIRLSEWIPTEENDHVRCLKKYMDPNGDHRYGDTREESDLFSNLDFSACFDPVHVYSISWKGDNWVWGGITGRSRVIGRVSWRPKSSGPFSRKDVDLTYGNIEGRTRNVHFALITQLKKDCSGGKVTIFELDKSVVGVLNDWRTGLVDRDGGNHQKTTNYNIVFFDKDGEEIGVYPWQIPNGCLMNVKFAKNMGMVYAAPLVGCFGENLIQWRDFILEKDQLAQIASVKIELAD